MSRKWDLHCKTCNESAGFDWNHEDKVLSTLWGAREAISAIHSIQVDGLEVTRYTDDIHPWWFAKHKDHDVRLRDDSGYYAPNEHTIVGSAEQRPHLVGGRFQSDRYPTCPVGKVPLSTRDVTAQPLLWQYAQIRRAVDAEFAADLETALRNDGYVPPAQSMDEEEAARRLHAVLPEIEAAASNALKGEDPKAVAQLAVLARNPDNSGRMGAGFDLAPFLDDLRTVLSTVEMSPEREEALRKLNMMTTGVDVMPSSVTGLLKAARAEIGDLRRKLAFSGREMLFGVKPDGTPVNETTLPLAPEVKSAAIDRIKTAVPYRYDRSPSDLVQDLEAVIGAELDRAAGGIRFGEVAPPRGGLIWIAQPALRQHDLIERVLSGKPTNLSGVAGLWVVQRVARVDEQTVAVEAVQWTPPSACPKHDPKGVGFGWHEWCSACAREMREPATRGAGPCPPNEDGVPCTRGARDPDHTGICLGTEKGGGSVSWWRPDLLARMQAEERAEHAATEAVRAGAYSDLVAEREAQDAEHGGPAHDDTHTPADWVSFLFAKVMAIPTCFRPKGPLGGSASLSWKSSAPAWEGTPELEYRTLLDYRRRLVQIGALAVAALESLDRQLVAKRRVVSDRVHDVFAHEDPEEIAVVWKKGWIVMVRGDGVDKPVWLDKLRENFFPVVDAAPKGGTTDGR